MRITLNELLDLDYEGVARSIEEFIKGYVESSGAKGVVVGLSGGVDSTTTLYLLVRALGPERVLVLVMPDSDVTPEEDVHDAVGIAERLGVRYKLIDIKPIVASYLVAMGEAPDRRSKGNLRARVRMTLLYLYANMEGLLVAGTGDRSELLIGYFTKYGDGAVDFLPIGCLYKSQVRRLALHLGVPEKIALKPSSPRLWPGQLAEDELGMKYEEIDLILYALFDKGLSPEEAAKATGLPIEKVRRVLELHRASEHKRSLPPAPDPAATVWRFRRRKG
ncbi:NAD+ synthase [Hyperthermus butylicus]|uniref:NH(3)-dependent NAD(+) synthetase n=1 Tax=Hyperthermus butylicus (strain DSM 5456 / JCM 9403 / PLM1-5) TaxID=415426 RepID=NADE_HYPBU|nr:NAD+ synthase [Hyperthermus butylicus]A2BLB9.1 RecName: Full=NH(3)-dependent NAD(+) synthetase [Hyperthermus butylicus DSM 5456]ABM80780.1 NH(3)-dependent NAD(+) synthetase [Hyperthermus butylicus DSM 5456]